ncbi:MAG TPA: DUF308 domain-containing protein [Methylomirabilota bacterium]|nr:DUF308 domain-containing protein [Methylomirabilota bacterium]
MANEAPVGTLVHVPLKSGWLLALGIVLIVVGTFSVVVSMVATLASVLLFGWLLLFTGAVEAGYAFRQAKWSGILLHVVNGVLSLVAGFLLVANPAAGALVLTLLMAMFFMIGGLFRIVTTIVMKLPHQGWLLLSGIVTLLLGIFIWRQLPGAAVWVIGTFVGIDMLFIGWSWVMLALAARARSA